MESDDESSLRYEIPVSATVVKGISAQLLVNTINELNAIEYINNRFWKNILRVLSEENINYRDLIGNIRDAIREKVPHKLILTKLFQEFNEEQDEIRKHNLAIMQAAVLISHHVDFLKKTLSSYSYLELPVEIWVDICIGKIADSIIVLSAFGQWGLGIAIGFSKKVIKNNYEKNIKIRIEKLFEELMNEIQ